MLDRNIAYNDTVVKPDSVSTYGADNKIVERITKFQKRLSPIEKDEIAVKYRNGMTMTAAADLYSCHYTAVRKVLCAQAIVFTTKKTIQP